jgi:hypothetical protein
MVGVAGLRLPGQALDVLRQVLDLLAGAILLVRMWD